MRTETGQTVLVSSGALLSRLLGFGRDAGMAWLLGGSGIADAMTAALRIPYLVRRLFGEGTLSLSLTVACTQTALKNEKASFHLASRVTRVLGLWTAILVALAFLRAKDVVSVLAPGLDATDVSFAADPEEAVRLFRICIPYVFFTVLAAGNMALLHSRRCFLLPSLTPALFNVVVLAFAGLAALLPGTDPACLLAGGVLCGGLLQWLSLLPAVNREQKRQICSPHPSTGMSLPEIRIGNVLGGIFGAAMPQLAFLLCSVLVSFLPEGHMSALFYAERLMEFPLGVLGAATGIAVTPYLATLARASHDRQNGFSQEIRRSLRLSLALSLPAAAGLAAIATPLVTVLLHHGAFDARAVSATVSALLAYLPGLPAYALSRPLLAACHAMGNNRTPVRAAVTGLVLTGAAGGTLLWIGHTGEAMAVLASSGPPLGVSLGLWANAWLLWRAIQKTYRITLPWRGLLWQGLGTLCTFSMASSIVFWCSQVPLSSLVALLCAIPTGILVYASVLFIGDRELFHSLIRKKFSGSTKFHTP